jgi:hypothetical protein
MGVRPVEGRRHRGVPSQVFRILVLVRWPGLPGEANACAQPKCRLSTGDNSWLTTSHVP